MILYVDLDISAKIDTIVGDNGTGVILGGTKTKLCGVTTMGVVGLVVCLT